MTSVPIRPRLASSGDGHTPQGWVVADALQGLAVRHSPHDLAFVEIDRRDAPPMAVSRWATRQYSRTVPRGPARGNEVHVRPFRVTPQSQP